MSTKKKKASARKSTLKDLSAKKSPKGGSYTTSIKVTPGRSFLNPQPLPP